jgi:antitoxin (DNA-binding transcriptional repressor) of toxin-antitoxin stability system
MKSVSVREMRAKLSKLEDVLASAGEVTITRRGKAIARILPMPGRDGVPTHDGLRAKMPKLKIGSAAAIRQERNER